MKMEKINLRLLLLSFVLLTGLLQPALQAQGWRITQGNWGGGPYMADGNKVAAIMPLPNGKTLSVINYPSGEASYYFGISWPSGPTGTRSIPFDHTAHYFCRDAFAETIDSVVVLEERLPTAGGPRRVHLTKYHYYGTGPSPIDSTFGLLWASVLLSNDAVNFFAHALLNVSDGYVVLASKEQSPGSALRDLVLLKTDLNGAVLWTQTFQTPDDDYGVELVPAADGGFFLLKTVVPAANPGSFRTVLVKTDALGSIDWETDLTNGDSNEPYDLAATADGNLLISGVNHSSGDDVFLIKADATGAVVWRKDLLMPQWLFSNASVMEDANGDVVTAATFTDTNASLSDILLIKTTSNGDPVWEINIGRFNRTDVITEMTLRQDGSYLFGGYIDVGGAIAAMLVKTDVNGIIKAGIIEGNVFDDLNFDCAQSPGEIPLENWVVQAHNTDLGTFFYGDTDANGNYRIECDTGAYLINLALVSPHDYWQSCTGEASIHIGYLETEQVDFPLQPLTSCAYMTVEHTLSRVRACDTTTFYVHYCNEGTATGEDASIRMVIDPRFTLLDSEIPVTVSGDTLYFPLGDVGIGDCGDFSFTAFVDCDAPLFATLCSEAHIYPDSVCVDSLPFWSGAFIEASGLCDGNTVRFTLRNTGSQPTAAPLDYIVIEDAVLLMGSTYELGSGGTLDIPVTATGATYRLVAQQEPGAPGNSVPIAVVEGCVGNSGNEPSSGFVDQFEQNDGDAFISVGCWQVLNSFDPNDKQASPAGFEEPHYIFKDTDLEYRIRFQNTGNDAAYRVMVVDSLSPLLDPATVRPGASSHPYTFEMESNGVLRFTFSDINLPHQSADEAGSQGFVSFRVAQKRGNEIGDVIENSAAIYFDYNAPVITNTTWHTLHEPWIDIINGSVETFAEQLEVKIFPNPMGNQATLEIQHLESGVATFQLLDQTGREVMTQPFTGNTLSLERNGLPAGLYFFQIVQEGRLLATGKVVVQ